MIRLNKKILITLTLTIVAICGFFFFIQNNEKSQNVLAVGEGWLSGWQNRKPITITNNMTPLSGTIMGSPVFGSEGKFGKAVSLDGTDDYITFPNSSDWDFDGDFTIDFWLNSSDITAYQFPLSHRNYPTFDGSWHFYIENSKFNFSAADNSGGFLITLYDTTVRSSNTWYHVAIVRSGATASMYVNGSLALTDSAASGTISDDDSILDIGYLKGYGSYLNGKIDELRISKGIARWTANFTPQTTPYAPDSYDKLLLHFDEAAGSTAISYASSLINYQNKVNVSYVSGMNSDFSDLRFTSSDGSTLLDYWIESYTASNSAVVWVEVPAIESSAKIYMYYGKSGATTTSNGENTFPLFDDFSGTLSDWTTGGGGTVAITSGRIGFSGGVYTNNTFFKSNTTFPFGSNKGYAVEFKTWEATIAGIGYFWSCGFFETLNSTAVYNTGFGSTYSYASAQRHTGVNYNRMYHYPYPGVTTYYTEATLNQDVDVSVNLGTASAKYYYPNEVSFNSSTSSTIAPATSLVVGCTNYDAGGGGTYGGVVSFDAIFVRKYVASEPTLVIGSVETEECRSSETVICTQTVDGDYRINKYTLVDNATTGTTTWTVPTGVTSVEYLVVGGGGSGGSWVGAGGGAGGYRTNYGGTGLSVSGNITITVGAGGASVTSAQGNNGASSSLGTLIVSAGGGGGGGGDTSQAIEVGKDGGSGGGGGYYSSAAAGGAGNVPAVTPVQGYAGGAGVLNGEYYGGGGGGAGAVGATATTGAGAGGVGLSNSITGTATYYAGGGGGGSYTTGSGAGGNGGGGAGSTSTTTAATAGTSGTGGGGGGTRGQTASGAGGSGVVIVRYLAPVAAPVIAEVTSVTTPTADTTPNYIFSSTEAGTITYGGSCSSATTTATSGNNTITFNTLAEGTYSDCTIKVTNSSSVDSNVLTVASFVVSLAAVNNSCWYCDYYFDETNSLKTGKNGFLDFSFTYQDANSLATLSGYRIAVDTENLSLSNIDSQADVIVPDTTTWVAGGSAAVGATVTNSQISVKDSPNASLEQIGYGTGSAKKLYYWWIKLKNSNGTESAWIPGPSFYTPKRHYPIVRVMANKELAAIGTDIQFCAGTDLTDQTTESSRDACYSTCWTGAPGSAVVATDNTDWKCSVCYNSSNQPVSCTDPTLIAEGKTNFEWSVPSGYVAETDYSYQSSTTSTSSNPIIKFNNITNTLKMSLGITGSECGNTGESMTIQNPMPVWKEVSPF